MRMIIAAIAAMVSSTPIAAESLIIQDVNAPAVNCVFQPTCTITVSDSTSAVALPYIAVPGTAWLQSRLYTGAAGTPAAGLHGYVYRLSLTEASGAAECMLGLVLNFGSVVKLPYPGGPEAHVFVITSGGLGSIGIKSAEKTGDVIDFAFSKPLCLSGGPDVRNTTYFFGLAASATPKLVNAHIYGHGHPPIHAVQARVPNH